MLNFALDEVLRDLSTQGRFFIVCFNAGVRGLGEGAWVPNLCPPVPVPSIHPSAWNRNSRKFISNILHSPAPIPLESPLQAPRSAPPR
jgi:hypothetical protein